MQWGGERWQGDMQQPQESVASLGSQQPQEPTAGLGSEQPQEPMAGLGSSSPTGPTAGLGSQQPREPTAGLCPPCGRGQPQHPGVPARGRTISPRAGPCPTSPARQYRHRVKTPPVPHQRSLPRVPRGHGQRGRRMAAGGSLAPGVSSF